MAANTGKIGAAGQSGHGGNVSKLAARVGISEGDLVDFSASINPLGPPAYLRPLVSSTLDSLLHYPDPENGELVAAIADHYRVASEQVIVGNGSTEIIFALTSLPVHRVLVPVPSYIGYSEAVVASGLPISYLPLVEERDFAIDWQQLADNLRAGDLLFLGQPNNPTGQLFDLESLAVLAEKFPGVFFIIDEAFADFVEPPLCSAMTILGRGLGNIVVLRSMTKFYAIPGLRLGFAVAAPEIAAQIRAQLPPWSVNTLAQTLGSKFIEDLDYAQESRKYTTDRRVELAAALRELVGLKVFKGAVNYLLVKVERDDLEAAVLAERLLSKGIAIRVCDNFQGLDNRFFRVAVRGEAENSALVAALKDELAPAKKIRVDKKTPALMFQGTCSDAGKSILTAALCRILLQDGLRVAPFKSQNMSLNSFVSPDGEMGRAQVVQAQASRLDPEVRMNPILLKPCSEVGSQVIVNGQSVGNMVVDEYIKYKPQAFAAAQTAYDSLAADYEVVILEGAGSPAEVNLKGHDIVNMRMAQYAQAPVVLVGDIDRGGVFASFVGTMEVLAEWERRLIAGFLVNRFRGQESLLAGAFDYLWLHTKKPVLGVVPYISDLGLPEEDSVSYKKGLFNHARPDGDHVEIALIDLPHISNFTDFEPLLAEPDVHLRVVKEVRQLAKPDAIIIPGSKNVINDLTYLKDSGLAQAISGLAQDETEIVGICGGFQMLGSEISDPHHIESSGLISGLGLLPVATVLAPEKTLTRQVLIHIGSGQTVQGYEIHHGRTLKSGEPVLRSPDGTNVDAGAIKGRVWGTYLHGIFDGDSFRHWFVEQLRLRRGLSPYKRERPVYDLEPAFDHLAAVVRERLDMDVIYRLLGL